MMKKFSLILAFVMILSVVPAFLTEAGASSYMSDKTEIPVDLEVSGAEALCQTEDGLVWIAQYSGLTCYDSKEFTTYKSFEYEGQEYALLNVRALAAKGSELYIATSEHVFVHKENRFEPLPVDGGTIRDLVMDEANGLIYISSMDKGGIIYDIEKRTRTVIPGTEDKNVTDIALDTERSTYYYQLDEGVFGEGGKEVLMYPRILDIYSHGDLLYIGEESGIIHRYDMKNGRMLDDIIVPDQVNKMLYSDADGILFVACEKNGIYCVDFGSGEPVITLAGDLDNKSQLVDLMIDYEGNLWVASHYIGASGVSIITQNALSELLYDDAVWQALNAPPAFDRNVYAVERYGDILYIIATTRIYRYDLQKKEILPDNVIMQTIDAYADARTQEGRDKGDDNFTFAYAPKDVEVFNGKVYFAVSGVGLVEYDPGSESVVIYDADDVAENAVKTVGDPDLTLTNTIRCLRSFDGYLAMGYTRGVIKFDGKSFSVMNIGSNVLYINKTKDGKLLFDRTQGLYVIDDGFTGAEEIPTEKEITGNRLKFLVDGDYIYYTLNSRLFRLNTADGSGASEEITIPYIKGSIVELSKISYTGRNGETRIKYIIGSQTQVYIADSLEGDTLADYEFYDSTNGLQPIIANTSGYYDEEEQKYYLQSTNGIFVYDFNETRDVSIPVKIAVTSIDLDGTHFYGNDINIGQGVYRVAFNLSVFGFRPNKGYTVYYKLDGIDSEYAVSSDDTRIIYYTNLAGGEYTFRVYVTDEYGQQSNTVEIHLVKEKKLYERPPRPATPGGGAAKNRKKSKES